MTKEITKAFIIQQIQDKFKLREFEPEVFTFSERVVPIYDISSHLMAYTADKKEVSITATGGYEFYMVPEDERWHLAAYNVVFMTSGAYKVGGLFIDRKRKLQSGATVYLDLTKNQTESYAVDLPKTVILDSGDKLSVLVDSYTSTANLRVYIDFTKETLR